MAITVARLMIWVGSETQEALKGLQGVDKTLEGFGAKAQRAGQALTLGVTVPLVGVGTAAVKTAADFETNMNVLQATSQATASEMGLLNDAAMELGADLELPGTSAADAAEAMLELAKSGLSVTDTMNSARGVLQLSAAGNISNARAAEIASNALNAFSLAGEEATHVADLLAAGANASSAEVEDMADSLAMSAAVASSAGISIEDLTAMIAEMANQGIKGSDAGTSLKQMILSLQAPTDKAKELMHDLGISIYDAQGNMEPMAGIIGQFQERLSGLTQEQRNAALATIFGSDAVRAANVVLMDGADAFEAMREAVDREGAAAELAGARMEGLGGSFYALKKSIETAMLAAVELFSEDIEGLARDIAEVVNSFSELDEGTQKAIVGFLALTAAIGPALTILGYLSSGAGVASAALLQLPTVVASISTAFAAWNAGMTLTTSLMAGFGALPVTLGAIAVAAAAGAGVWATWNEKIVKTNEEGRNATSNTWKDFFNDLNSNGADSAEVMDEFSQAHKRMMDQVAGAGVAGAFVDANGLTRDALRELSTYLAATGQDFNEYTANMTDAAEETGLFVKEVDGQERVYQRIGSSVRDVTDDIGLLSEEQFNLQQQTAAASGGLDGMFERFKMTGQGADDLAASLANVGANAEDMQARLEGALSNVNTIVAGSFGGEIENFQTQQGDIRVEINETRERIEELSGLQWATPAQKQELEDLRASLWDLQAQLEETARVHEETMKRMAFDMLQQRASSDGLTENEVANLTTIAQQWGLWDEKTAEVVGSINQNIGLLDTKNPKDLLSTLSAILGLDTEKTFDFTVNIHVNGSIPNPAWGDEGLGEADVFYEDTGSDTGSVSTCFIAGTPVDTPDGPRAIETIQVGDLVSVLTSKGHLVESRVTWTVTGWREDCVELLTSDGQRFTCSPNHRFMVPGGWRQAGSLEPGMQLIAVGAPVFAISVTPAPGGRSVFNLSVEHPEHTYLVGGIQVHNIGYKAAGGPVAARTPYWVGENGIEMFVPDQNGTIVSNTDLEKLFGQAGNNQTTVIFQPGAIVTQPGQSTEEIAYAVAEEIKRRSQ